MNKLYTDEWENSSKFQVLLISYCIYYICLYSVLAGLHIITFKTVLKSKLVTSWHISKDTFHRKHIKFNTLNFTITNQLVFHFSINIEAFRNKSVHFEMVLLFFHRNFLISDKILKSVLIINAQKLILILMMENPTMFIVFLLNHEIFKKTESKMGVWVNFWIKMMEKWYTKKPISWKVLLNWQKNEKYH